MQKLKEIAIRAFTGAVFVTCVVGSVLLGAYLFFALFLLVSVGAVVEYCRLVNKQSRHVSLWL